MTAVECALYCLFCCYFINFSVYNAKIVPFIQYYYTHSIQNSGIFDLKILFAHSIRLRKLLKSVIIL